MLRARRLCPRWLSSRCALGAASFGVPGGLAMVKPLALVKVGRL